MTKYMSFGAALILLAAAPLPASAQQKAGGEAMAGKCRAQVRDRVPTYNQPSGKKEAQILFRKCMTNGGKI